jgi:hypothetical protein
MSGGTVTYTYAHQQLRKHLLAQLAADPGQPCARCGRPMFVWMALDLGHTDGDPSRYHGLEHARCNRKAGQAVTAAILRRRNAALKAAGLRLPPAPRRRRRR